MQRLWNTCVWLLGGSRSNGPSKDGWARVQQYYAQHGDLPPPSTRHEKLQLQLPDADSATQQHKNNSPPSILVIGDVHGCYDEMLQLHATALQQQQQRPFDHVLLVGDLCNKGPQSAKVLRHVRTTPRWSTVRGNHDNGMLRAALASDRKKQKKKYEWLFDSTSNNECVLTEDELHWMSELPYTIRIPGNIWQQTHDTLIVHAGLLPNVPLEEQSIHNMTTLRECHTVPWGEVWQGPEFVVFGHDARREIQRHEHCMGLDSGCCYGKKLSGLILPQRTLVQVPAAQEYCPISQ